MEALQFEGTMAVLGAENLGTKMSVADDPSKPTSIFENSEGGRRRRTLFGAGRRRRRPPETRAFSTHVVFVGVEEGERERERDKLDICGVRAQGEHRRVYGTIYIRRPLSLLYCIF